MATRKISFTFIALCTILLHSRFILLSSVVLVLRNRHSHDDHRRSPISQNQTSCSLFTGSWVRDDSYPLYQYSCPIIDPEFNCQMYGRPDSGYLKYRWQPINCQIPRFNGEEFLRRMRGKSVMFVGDSLGRNQWQSLICMISAELASSSPTEVNRGDPISAFKFLEYGVTVSYYRAPYLVDIDSVEGKRVLKLDEIRGNGNAWEEVDVLCFDTGHWWSHNGGVKGWDYMEAGGKMYEDMDRTVALERGLKTWARWVDSSIDATRTKLFFQGMSPTHSNCYGETMPMAGSLASTDDPGSYPDQMKVLERVVDSMNNPPFLLDITLLSAMRKDAHPSIYSGLLTPAQRANPDRSSDCSHWCLPGLPDTWNQLFYTALFF